MLKLIKILHTLIWLVMVSAIFYVLYCGIAGVRNLILWSSIGLIIFEGVVLALNKGSCPLTPIARKYTSDTKDNFDIYIPNWLARHNKTIFTTIFIIGLALVLFK